MVLYLIRQGSPVFGFNITAAREINPPVIFEPDYS